MSRCCRRRDNASHSEMFASEVIQVFMIYIFVLFSFFVSLADEGQHKQITQESALVIWLYMYKNGSKRKKFYNWKNEFHDCWGVEKHQLCGLGLVLCQGLGLSCSTPPSALGKLGLDHSPQRPIFRRNSSNGDIGKMATNTINYAATIQNWQRENTGTMVAGSKTMVKR